MAKFYGAVGFVFTEEEVVDGLTTGVNKAIIRERPYYGDIISASRRWSQNSDSINRNITISDKISIIADEFANQNIGAMRYVELKGSLWNIESVSIDYPRLILSIGGVYNGESSDVARKTVCSLRNS